MLMFQQICRQSSWGIWCLIQFREINNRDLSASLRSKRFRRVSEQKESEERDFEVLAREKWGESNLPRERKRLLRRLSISGLSFLAICVM